MKSLFVHVIYHHHGQPIDNETKEFINEHINMYENTKY